MKKMTTTMKYRIKYGKKSKKKNEEIVLICLIKYSLAFM